ncbi:restriction endonuclease subunit S [Spelaeicoccus albus]|uniref:Type I restriction enzyme S subunit n=1 Tax=Spelaeicoccus albus TaxID=1280376 RepID=A0A7Z0AB92_9MICO|nr:restriction endonuclease subunit S [Spelaeicoccus albus]NYI67006.1 type I restriction enzyme S subunit [Spelaeicoccus albus]
MTREDWIGDLPPAWTIVRLGALGSLGKGSGGSKEDNRDSGVPVVRYGELYTKFDRVIRDAHSFISPDDSYRYTPLPRGSLVFAGSGEDPEEIGKAALSLLASPAFVGGDSVVFTPHRAVVDSVYLTYVLDSKPLRAHKAIRSTGFTVVHISAGKLKTLPIPLPPLDEQRAIADYLDHETAQIDALVTKQDELIRLLKERRIAVRSALATRGVSADVDLSPTDLVWAPKVPAAWRVVPLTSIAKLESGHTPSRSRPEWWVDAYIPWISLNDVSALSDWEYIAETVNLISDAGIANSSARLLPVGTVVLSRDATIGRSAIMQAPMATSQHFANWVCGPALNPRYLWLLFTSAMQQYFDSLTDGSTIRTIGMGDLRAFKIPLPSPEEQERIVYRAHHATSRIDTLIAKAEEHIALAKERRAALVTAAVTGQFDVRTARKAG